MLFKLALLFCFCITKVFLEFIPNQLSLIKFSVTISWHIFALPQSPDPCPCFLQTWACSSQTRSRRWSLGDGTSFGIIAVGNYSLAFLRIWEIYSSWGKLQTRRELPCTRHRWAWTSSSRRFSRTSAAWSPLLALAKEGFPETEIIYQESSIKNKSTILPGQNTWEYIQDFPCRPSETVLFQNGCWC